MNLQHLKYAIEIEDACSISKAAENLYMGQPNLSRAIKELEFSLGITIFKRTSKGVVPTVQGAEFLSFAKSILSQVDELEHHYHQDKTEEQSFSISVPRASYIANAFINLAKTLNLSENIDINYKETNNMRAIKNIVEEGFNLGIIRYMKSYKKYFDMFLNEKNLTSKLICDFKCSVYMSKHHPLAKKEEITAEDLAGYIEIIHGDPFIPSLSTSDAKKIELPENVDKRIYVYERGGQFDLLSEVHTTFMKGSPIPESLRERYGLVKKLCSSFDTEYVDVLIFKKNHVFSEIEDKFIFELEKCVDTLINVQE